MGHHPGAEVTRVGQHGRRCEWTDAEGRQWVRHESPDELASWYFPETTDSEARQCAALARAIEDLHDRMPEDRGRAAASIAARTFPDAGLADALAADIKSLLERRHAEAAWSRVLDANR